MQLPPVRAAILALVDVMRSGGTVGVAIYVAAYMIGGALTAPIALLSGIAGFVYGPARGFLIASPACLAASLTAFVVGRTALRKVLERRVGQSPRFVAISRAAELEGLKITFFLRLTPVMPQNFLSYALSLTRVRTRDFAAGTWLGLIPMTAFQVYVGSLVRDASDLFEAGGLKAGPWSVVVPLVGLVVSAAAVFAIARHAKRALDRATAPYEERRDIEVIKPEPASPPA